jgi:phosphoglycerol transferase MdoB-like AlkP superfamily enzyme
MPELRGLQATDENKAEWTRAYDLYLVAPGDKYDKKKDRTERIDYVARQLNLTRKQAKRRIRNYEAWQRNIKKGLVKP